MERGNRLIKQPYAITMARHRLNVHEMRIMVRIIEAMQPNMVYAEDRSVVQQTLLGDTILHLRTKDLLPSKSENYACVKRALKSLEQKVISIRGKDSKGEYETNSRLIMKSKYYLHNQMVEIQLDRDLLPDLLALAKNYSQYLVEVALNSSSHYVMKLYLFISHWRDKTKKTVMLETLRDLLQLETKYEKPKDLKKRILDPASKELKKRADVWFEIVAPIKSGRSIRGYIFKIYKRGNDRRLEEVHTQNIKNILRELFDLRDYHLRQLTPIISRQELQDHVYEKIQKIGAQVRKGNIQHVKAYVVKALQNEFSEPDQALGDDAISQEELASVGEHIKRLAQKSI